MCGVKTRGIDTQQGEEKVFWTTGVRLMEEWHGTVDTWVLNSCWVKHQVVSGVYQQPGGRGADVTTCRLFWSVDGFRSSVPCHGHIRSCTGTAQRQDTVCRVVQVEHGYRHWQRGRTTTQTQKLFGKIITLEMHYICIGQFYYHCKWLWHFLTLLTANFNQQTQFLVPWGWFLSLY